MREEIISFYMNFKKNKIKELGSILFYAPTNMELREKCFETYITTFINCYYFNFLATLDAKNVDNYDFSVVVKEIDGVKYELLNDLENSEVLDDSITYKNNIELIEYSRIVVLASILLDINCFINQKKEDIIAEIETILNHYKNIVLENRKLVVEQLATTIKNYLSKEEKFFKGIDDNSFKVNYLSYLAEQKNIFIDMDCNIPKLSRNYRTTSINKIYNSEKSSLEKTKTMISLVLFDILKKIKDKKELDNYFLLIPESALEKKTIWIEFLNQWQTEYVRNKFVFLIDYKVYLSHKTMLKQFEGKFNFGILIDLTHIQDVQRKIESLEEISLIKYIVINKIKDSDYDFVKKYETVPNKTILFQEFKEQ